MITNEKDILSFNEVRELLGISKSSLYKLTSTNMIPCHRPTNGRLFFKREQIILWLTQDKSLLEDSNITKLNISKNDGE
ncbi:helix-turn-helix transcriptional regulator [Flavobacterium sp.]|uniref:helix-turn-helix transcriptional regulator n=1 Tax=Flavobacterium sp. TaxID=239 RepID=UPI0039C8AE90